MVACVESYDQAAGATYQTFDDNGEKHNAQPTVHNVYGLTSLCWPLPPPHHDQHQCLHAHHAANVCVCIVCVCVCIVSTQPLTPQCMCVHCLPTMCVHHRSHNVCVCVRTVFAQPSTSQQAQACPPVRRFPFSYNIAASCSKPKVAQVGGSKPGTCPPGSCDKTWHLGVHLVPECLTTPRLQYITTHEICSCRCTDRAACTCNLGWQAATLRCRSQQQLCAWCRVLAIVHGSCCVVNHQLYVDEKGHCRNYDSACLREHPTKAHTCNSFQQQC